MLRKSPGICLTRTEGTKAGLLRNENTPVETGGGHNQMFILELNADKKAFIKQSTYQAPRSLLRSFQSQTSLFFVDLLI